jgi:hypothetical protein
LQCVASSASPFWTIRFYFLHVGLGRLVLLEDAKIAVQLASPCITRFYFLHVGLVLLEDAKIAVQPDRGGYDWVNEYGGLHWTTVIALQF